MGFLAVLFWFALGVLTFHYEVRYWDGEAVWDFLGLIGFFFIVGGLLTFKAKKDTELYKREWDLWEGLDQKQNFPTWRKENRSKWQKFCYWAFFLGK